MAFENFDYRLMARYLADETSVEEDQFVEQWIAGSTENKKEFNQYRKIWNFFADNQSTKIPIPDSEEEWKKLQHHFVEQNDHKLQFNTSKFSAYHAETPSTGLLAKRLLRIAAFLVVAGLLGIFAYQNWYQNDAKKESSEPILRQVSTASAQRANVELGDGTTVMLNASSNLRFPHRFDQDVREVFLEGQAYFNVKRNTSKPFIIHSDNTSVKVLGTSFSVRSYPKDKQVYVVVADGRVSFKSDSTGSDNRKVLTASEMGIYSEMDNHIQRKPVDDMQLYLSWRKGYLKFKNKPMADVADELERRYGITVVFGDKKIARKPLTAYLKSRSIQDILGIVSKTIDVNYKLESDTVRFYPKQNTN